MILRVLRSLMRSAIQRSANIDPGLLALYRAMRMADQRYRWLLAASFIGDPKEREYARLVLRACDGESLAPPAREWLEKLSKGRGERRQWAREVLEILHDG